MKPLILATLTMFALVGCNRQETAAESASQPSPPLPLESSVPSADSARSALDWNGVYQGNVPCDDCEATQLLVELKQDGNYMLSRSYTDKMSVTVMEEGEIMWNDAGNTVQIAEFHFFVAENQLFLVDEAGYRVQDSDANEFVLLKSQ